MRAVLLYSAHVTSGWAWYICHRPGRSSRPKSCAHRRGTHAGSLSGTGRMGRAEGSTQPQGSRQAHRAGCHAHSRPPHTHTARVPSAEVSQYLGACRPQGKAVRHRQVHAGAPQFENRRRKRPVPPQKSPTGTVFFRRPRAPRKKKVRARVAASALSTMLVTLGIPARRSTALVPASITLFPDGHNQYAAT